MEASGRDPLESVKFFVFYGNFRCVMCVTDP